MAKRKWNADMAFKAYELARSGCAQQAIAKALGITYATYLRWKKTKPLFAKALTKGRKFFVSGQRATLKFEEYVYQQLSPRLQRLWDKINELEDAPSGVQRIEAMLERHGQRARQYLFFHAWVTSNFSLSTAMRKVNISKSTFTKWKDTDPDFAELARNVEWYRKNFFEDHLMMLVAGGDTQATIFVNKTLNRDRGYGDQTTINAKIEGEIQHKHLPLDPKQLPVNLQRQLLAHIRKTKQVESVEVPHE